MKRAAACLGFAFAVLGAAAPAWADDAPVGSNLQAGGLKPPEAVQSAPTGTAPTATEANLDRADKEDSGRGLEFVWLNAEAGPEYLGLETFKANGLSTPNPHRATGGPILGSPASKDLGMTYGAGLGVRLLVFTLGARFRYGNFPNWQIWTLNAEAGMHIPLGRVEPYVTFGAGYASLAYDVSKGLNVTIPSAHGFDVRAGFGVDVYLTNTLSIGGNLTGETQYLKRKGNDTSDGGSGVGAGATLSAVLGLHF